MKIYYYENGQFEKATGASIFAESENSDIVQLKLPMALEGSVVYATFLLPFSQNTDQYGQYKAESLLLNKVVDEEDGGFMYEGRLAEGYLVNNGTAYISGRIQLPAGVTTYTASSSTSITIGEDTYTISYTTGTPALLKLTDSDSNVYQAIDTNSIMIGETIYLIGEDESDNLTLTTDIIVKTTEQVQFIIQAGGGYTATAVLPEFGEQLAMAIANLQNQIYDLDANKQDKDTANTDNIITTNTWQTSTIVVTAINNIISQVATNITNIQTNANNIATNTSDIAYLYNHITQPEEYIGQMTGSSLPTNSQLTQFVEDTVGREPKNADVVIFILEIAGETDKNYKYIYSAEGWNGYEIPPIEEAGNGSLGIIEGTYNVGSSNNTLVDIVGGKIVNIFIKDNSNQYRNIVEYANTTNTTISNIISGSQSVGLALKAIADNLGNNIIDTYMTQSSGATKQYVRQYSLPREFNDVYFISADGYSTTVPTTPASGIQFTKQTSAVGDFQIFQIVKDETADYELSSKNSARTVIYVAADEDCDVHFRLTTEAQISGGAWKTLGIDLTQQVSLTSGNIAKIEFTEPFTSLGDEVISIANGDYLRQTLEVVTQTSATITFNVYSNSAYSSSFALNSQTMVQKTLAGNIGQEQSILALGTAVTGGVDFAFDDPDTFLYNNTSAEFTLEYVGTINDNDIITLSLNGQDLGLTTPYGGNVLGKYLKQCYYSYDGLKTTIRFKGFINIDSGDTVTIRVEEDNLNMTTALTGSSAPTTSTTADVVGQFYIDTTNNKTYQCIAITTVGGTTTYTWVQLIRVTDIAENGPDEGGAAGVVKLQGTHYAGIIVNPTTKNMSIADTTDSDTFWNNRKIYGFAVKGNNIDKYLKLALGSTSAESDNTTTWSDTNKQNACGKIGASQRGIARL